MPLPATFHFSQNNLQDYLDCPRRFELRHLQRLEWPALQSEPVLEHEHQMILGQRFHQLVQQHLSGLPADLLADQAAADPDLQRWWQAFLNSRILDGLPSRRYPERQLSAPFAGFRLVAQYDLLAIPEKDALRSGKRAMILDWKTGSAMGKPRPSRLKDRVQTRMYPFLLCLAGRHLNGSEDILPEHIEMLYWFSEHPDQMVRFSYSPARFEEDKHFIQTLISEIQEQLRKDQPGTFILTPDERKCAFCNYRSLCQRSAKAGALDEIPDDLELAADQPLTLDFDSIEPIGF